MTTWAVIATGESLKPDPRTIADRVRHMSTVAVSDAFLIAPWAAALVACDGKWWRTTPGAMNFAGEKWCANGQSPTVPRVLFRNGINTNSNSGLLGLYYAVTHGAKRILLLGIDMGGTHYFGLHKDLPNTSPGRFGIFIGQFNAYAKQLQGVEVINCSMRSALNVFPKMTLDEALETETA